LLEHWSARSLGTPRKCEKPHPGRGRQLLNRELLCDWLEAEGHDVPSAVILQLARNVLTDNNPTRSTDASLA